MKLLKIGGIIIALLLALTIGAVAYFAASFDPNAERARLIELVREKTGRDLRIDGDIALTFFPRLGVALDGVALSARPAPGAAPLPFARLGAARVSLRILPLLSGRLIVDHVVLAGLDLELVRHADGSSNFDDLLGRAPASAKPELGGGLMPIPDIDVAGIQITGASVGWRDERDGSALRVSGLELRTGRIAASAPGELSLRARVEGTLPKLALHVELLTGYRFDPAARVLRLNGLAASARGDAPGAPGLEANFSALEIALDGTAQRLDMSTLRLVASDAAGLHATLTAPRLLLATDHAEGGAVDLALRLDRPGSKLEAKIALAPPILREGRVSFERLDAKVDLQIDGLAIQGELGTPLEADLAARTLSLTGITGRFRVKSPTLPPAGTPLDLAGTGTLDWGKETSSAALTARFETSNLQAQLRSRGFSPPQIDVSLIADRLDLDRTVPAAPAKTGLRPADTPVEFGALAALNGTLSLRAGSLRAGGVSASNLHVTVRANGGKIVVAPLRAELYRGTVQASARVDAATGAITTNGVLTGIDVGPLVRELAHTDVVEGRGNARFAITSRGATVAALRRGLDGTASIALRDGAVKGINLAQAIRKAKAAVGGGGANQATQSTEQTDFSALDASFVIRAGVARNDDLALTSPLLRVGGAGAIDIGAGSLDYLLKATVVGSLTGQGGRELESLRGVTIPVRITGPFEKIAYRLDLSAALADTAKQQLRRRFEEKLGIGAAPGGAAGSEANSARKPAERSRQKPADVLKGLFGR